MKGELRAGANCARAAEFERAKKISARVGRRRGTQFAQCAHRIETVAGCQCPVASATTMKHRAELEGRSHENRSDAQKNPTHRKDAMSGMIRYSKKKLMVDLIVEVPTVIVKVALALPATGFTHVSVLPAQNPLPGPVCPRVPNAVSS